MFHYRFDGSMPHMAELEVCLTSSEKYCTVEFRDSPDTTENSNLLSTLNLNWSSPSTGGQVSHLFKLFRKTDRPGRNECSFVVPLPCILHNIRYWGAHCSFW